MSEDGNALASFRKEELSLEETNKLRIQLGLKPLLPEASENDDRLSVGTSQQAVAKADAEVVKRSAPYQRLSGPTLGQCDTDVADSDNTAWLKRQAKRAKELAQKRAKEQEEVEELAQRNAEQMRYTDKDVQGLRVAHDLHDFASDPEGSERILTLRDSKVIEGGDGADELVNTELEEQQQRLKRNNQGKDTRKLYEDLSEVKSPRGEPSKSRGVLSKYDQYMEEEEQFANVTKGFTIGEDKKPQLEEIVDPNNKRARSDVLYEKNREISDYLREGDIGFKKPKKKKRRETTRIRFGDVEEDAKPAQATSELELTSTGIAETPKSIDDISMVDDDELNRSLAIFRRKQAKRAYKKLTPQQVAQNLHDQRMVEEKEEMQKRNDRMQTDGDLMNGNELVFDETDDFLQKLKAQANSRSFIKREHSLPEPISSESPAEKASEVAVHRDLDDISIKQEDKASNSPPTVSEKTLEEPLAIESRQIGGLASTLSLLRNQGLFRDIAPEQKERERQQQEYNAWLAKRRAEERLQEIEAMHIRGKGSANGQNSREAQNHKSEMEQAKQIQQRFRDYKPDVDLKYHDEFGRELSQKEAFKRLSHVFHGKQPGKHKQDLRLQRIAKEKQREKILAGDTAGSHIATSFVERAERSGKAHMTIGEGSRNSAPQDAEQYALSARDATETNEAREDGDVNEAVLGLDPRLARMADEVIEPSRSVSRGFLPIESGANASKKGEAHLAPPEPVLNGNREADVKRGKFKLAFAKPQ